MVIHHHIVNGVKDGKIQESYICVWVQEGFMLLTKCFSNVIDLGCHPALSTMGSNKTVPSLHRAEHLSNE